MSENGVDITTPTGRIVWGHPGKPRAKKHQDGAQKGQPVLDDQGKPVMEIAFGVAIPKADFQQHVWPAMAAEIATGYPNGAPPRFSYKYADGDGLDGEGKPFNTREGYAGHYVLAYTQRLSESFGPPAIFKFNPATGKYDTLGAADIKTGDYVQVGTNMKVNVATGTNTPSIYVNPRGINLVGYGTEIVTAGAVDPNAMFGGAAPALPPGATAAPQAHPGAPTMPGMGAPPPMAPPAAPGGMPGAPMMAPPSNRHPRRRLPLHRPQARSARSIRRTFTPTATAPSNGLSMVHGTVSGTRSSPRRMISWRMPAMSRPQHRRCPAHRAACRECHPRANGRRCPAMGDWCTSPNCSYDPTINDCIPF